MAKKKATKKASAKVTKKKTVKKSVAKKSSKNTKKADTITFKKPSLSKNFWLIVSIVLAVLLIINWNGASASVSSDVAGQAVVDFAAAQGASAQVVSVKQDGGLYEVTISIQGQQVPVYVTTDGKKLIPSVIDLDEVAPAANANTDTGHAGAGEGAFSDEDNAKIQEFSECLASKGFVVYAADWCPHCENLKAYFGGDANVAPFWKACQNADRSPTQHATECSSEGVTGFPTLKLNGEELQIQRTFEAIAAAVGCEAPSLS